MQRYLIGVTGAQGVGKSTFCRALAELLQSQTTYAVSVIGGLGDDLKRRGIPFGSAATPDGIAAAYTTHIRREMEAPKGIAILDRCIVDALAYVKSLAITSQHHTALYEAVSLARVQSLSLVIHLEMTGRFEVTTATHESSSLRNAVAKEIPALIAEFRVPHLTLNAAECDALHRAASEVLKVAGLGRSGEPAFNGADEFGQAGTRAD